MRTPARNQQRQHQSRQSALCGEGGMARQTINVKGIIRRNTSAMSKQSEAELVKSGEKVKHCMGIVGKLL
jgi:hypothetical protein